MRKIYLLLCMLFVACGTMAQIVAWQFDGAAGNEVTSNATTNSTDLQQSALSRGAGISPSSLVRTFSSDNFIGSMGTPGTKSDAVLNDEFMSFTIKAKPGFSVSLSTLDAKLRRTSTGPNAYIWKYSIDGISFIEIGSDVSFTSTATDGQDQTQISLATIGALQNVPNTTTITFRLYAWGATGSSGSFAFGRFAAGNTSNSLAIGGLVAAQIPTPIQLLSFGGKKEGSKNILKWTTASENNNKGFEIQSSTDGNNYSTIGFVPSLARGGMSSDRLQYNFADINPAGLKQFYRLNQVDYDGRSKLSNIVVVSGDKPLKFAIASLFPNPVATQKLDVIINAPKNAKITLVIADINGRILKQQVAYVEDGSNTIAIDINTMGKGLYFVRLLTDENTEATVGKFIKQ